MPGRVKTEIVDSVGWIYFDHPERRNALSSHMWGELSEAVRAFDADAAVRVIVMRGEGEEAFVSGADVSQFEGQVGADTSADLKRGGGNAFLDLKSVAKPLVAMIHGYCIGGGLAVALCADLRYASDDACFAIPAARLGVGYDIGGIDDLARLVGLSFAKEILFTARRYDASEALDMGLVNRVLPKRELKDHVLDLAERMANNAPLTIRSVKLIAGELMKDPQDRDRSAVKASVAACFESEDFEEGVAAFMQKRPPKFKGR